MSPSSQCHYCTNRFLLASYVNRYIAINYRTTAVTTEISLKECSAYGQIDQGGGEGEETDIYEHPQ